MYTLDMCNSLQIYGTSPPPLESHALLPARHHHPPAPSTRARAAPLAQMHYLFASYPRTHFNLAVGVSS